MRRPWPPCSFPIQLPLLTIAHVAARGSGFGGASAATSLLVSYAVAVAAGHVLILQVVTDNITTTDGNTNDHLACSDDKGNTYIKVYEYTNGNGAAAAGITVSVWLCTLQVAVSGTTNVTVTFSGSLSDRVGNQHEFTIAAGKIMQVVQDTGTPAGNVGDASNGFGSMSTSTLTNNEHLHFRTGGKEANDTTALTPTTNYTITTAQRSRNNALAVIVRGEFRINTSTGETSNPTHAVAGDFASIFVAFEEAVQPTGVGDVGSRMAMIGVGN